jgi:hypothetical protein
MQVIPPNDIADLSEYSNSKDFVVVGGGKTGMDTIIHLLEHRGVAVSKIRWIIPNDCYIIDRDDLFLGIDFPHFLFTYPFDPKVEPTAYKCCTLSREEYGHLKPAIARVVRLGRVHKVSEDAIHMKKGTIAADKDTVIIDCSSNGLTS